ncbi:hypothetical protein GGR51DRAFT_534404 [Nemania sp. FL0031]|nr:hypothetical protein GGR51DRAFT_534404 [Nemania sp. FL0031]
MPKQKVNWELYREEITELCVRDRFGPDGIREHLRERHPELFTISSRQVRGQTKKWGLSKKKNNHEMITALKLAVDQNIDLSRTDIMFRVRCYKFSLGEIIRYFGRQKDVQDILTYISGLPPEFEMAPYVELLYPLTDDPTGVNQVSINERYPQLEDDSTADESSETVELSPTPLNDQLDEEFASLGTPVSSPDEFRLVEKTIEYVTSYCMEYLASPRALSDDEPTYHKHTAHGILGSRIQDGIFHALQGDANFGKDFNTALDIVEPLFEQMHPMCVAQICASMAELMAFHSGSTLQATVSRELQAEISNRVLNCLLELLTKIAKKRASHHLQGIFSIFLSNPCRRQELVLKVMQRMTDCCGRSSAERHYWKGLYLKERYADCLYHAGVTSERYALRTQLLDEQRHFYGRTKRNVLWTTTNVADDFLESEKPSLAADMYNLTLRGANEFQGFDRAKIRFAALEGLAKVALLDVKLAERRQQRGTLATPTTNSTLLRRSKLMEAANYLEQAEKTAQLWFENGSRRATRVRLQLIVLYQDNIFLTQPELRDIS